MVSGAVVVPTLSVAKLKASGEGIRSAIKAVRSASGPQLAENGH